MKKKGFTIIELLGVIVILIIIFSLAIVLYSRLNASSDKTYYKTLEDSLLFAGVEYYSNNKNDAPSIYGDEKKVTADYLEDNGYTDGKINDSSGESCKLAKSYVGAYKDSLDKTNYYVCLNCGDYATDSLPCSGVANYSLGVRAKKKNSGNTYKIDGKSWSNENIVLTFETLNDMEQVILEDGKGNTKSCTLHESQNVKRCELEVSESGEYKAYAKNNDVESKIENLKILIDKSAPTFDFSEKGISNTIYIKASSSETFKNAINKVINIEDKESGIKLIEYSFEHDTKKDYYHNVNVALNFDVNKQINLGTSNLKVRVYNNAGTKTEKTIKYIVYHEAIIPKEINYCNDLTYNGLEQKLVKNPGVGYTFLNTTGIYAGNYKVTAKANQYYLFSDLTETKELNCTIKKKALTIRALNQTIVHGTTFNTTDRSKVSISGLVSGDTFASIRLSHSGLNMATKKRTITPSNAVIRRSSVVVTNSYNINYQTGTLVIRPKVSIAISGTREQSGYQNGARVTVTCSGPDNIQSLTISGEGSSSASGGTNKQVSLTLNSKGKKTIKGQCTLISEANNSVTSSYTIYVYTRDASCGCEKYNSKAASPCSCKTRNSCSNCNACGSSTSTTVSGTCTCRSNLATGANKYYSCSKSNSSCSSICSSRGMDWYSGNCNKSTKTTCKSCANSSCSCKTYNTCENAAFGCKTNKQCWHV